MTSQRYYTPVEPVPSASNQGSSSKQPKQTLQQSCSKSNMLKEANREKTLRASMCGTKYASGLGCSGTQRVLYLLMPRSKASCDVAPGQGEGPLNASCENEDDGKLQTEKRRSANPARTLHVFSVPDWLYSRQKSEVGLITRYCACINL